MSLERTCCENELRCRSTPNVDDKSVNNKCSSDAWNSWRDSSAERSLHEHDDLMQEQVEQHSQDVELRPTLDAQDVELRPTLHALDDSHRHTPTSNKRQFCFFVLSFHLFDSVIVMDNYRFRSVT